MNSYENTQIPKLFELMKERGLKAKDVSAATGISTSSFTDWKNGKMPTPQKLKVLADFFEVSVEYLIGSDEDPNALDLEIKAKMQQLSDEQKADVLKYIDFVKTKD